MIDTIKSIPIIDIISYYGVHFNQYSSKICCPFDDHNESEPSFHLRLNKNSFYCFGCKRGGSAIDFVMAMDADRHNIAIGDSFKQEQKYFDDFASYILKHQEKSIPYLKSRKIPEKIATIFNIGYCPNTLPKLSGKHKQYFLDSGILYPNFPRGYRWSMQGRVVIPVKMSSGYYLGFTGRDIEGNDPRYLNSKFEKNKTLFGWNVAKKYIYQKQSVYLVEGIFDVLAFFAQGIYNVVATLGTSLSDEQKNLLSNTLDIIVLYDGDRAGQNAILKIAESIQNVKKIEIPDGEDISSLHEKGHDLKKLLDQGSVKDVMGDLKEKDAVSALKIALQRLVLTSTFITVNTIYTLAKEYGVNTDEAYAIYLGLSQKKIFTKYRDKYQYNRKVKYHG